jgi:hypothetical protein
LSSPKLAFADTPEDVGAAEAVDAGAEPGPLELRDRALALWAEGRFATAWWHADAAARLDRRHASLAEELLEEWSAAHAVSVRLEPGAEDQATDLLLEQIRGQIDHRLVRWTEADDAILSGKIGRERVECAEQRKETLQVRHPLPGSQKWSSYTVERWSRTCTVGVFGSMRVGSHMFMMGRRLHASIEDETWPASPSIGLVGNPLHYAQDDAELAASAMEALVLKAASSIEQQVERFVRDRSSQQAVDPEDVVATSVLLERITGRAAPQEVAYSPGEAQARSN